MSIRTRRLDRNDGAIRRVAPQKGPDPMLRNDSCRQVSPSQVRNACDPHGPHALSERHLARDSRFAPGSFPRIDLPLEALN
jgi:hypothetical protein